MKKLILISLLVIPLCSYCETNKIYGWSDFTVTDLIYVEPSNKSLLILTDNKTKHCSSDYRQAIRLPLSFSLEPSKSLNNFCFKVDSNNLVNLKEDSIISFNNYKYSIYEFQSLQKWFTYSAYKNNKMLPPRNRNNENEPNIMIINGETKLCRKIGVILDCD
ncbi:hypothetical protein [Candidatus Methylopumilus planktonicus]|uniref:hypothetical protein n=1 Tax=Candidatus Methylopumilus planktonicus TaxID=1581557 RepID=UPI001123990B|nr:hypothetical protein [Candidatus Methylopumilus planktonicus]QDD11089.1 hypothetical protein FIT64_04505 [Candidatus Methylopumilus planktonicus]QDD23559.1 hypothetical protein FIT63_04505 [Candidatus Methylopumilus planktonicus]